MTSTIGDFKGNVLNWVQPKSGTRTYELRSEGDVIARLSFEKRSGTLAALEAEGEHWTFKREGFFHPRVTVREPAGDENIAVFTHSWSGNGTVEFMNGESY